MSQKTKAIAYVPLGYRAGTSDKVYVLIIILCETGYQTIARFGRNGSKLQITTKTESGVTWKTAESAFQRILLEKRGEGYEELFGSERMAAIAPIPSAYEVIPERNRDEIRQKHPETAVVTTPEQRERAERLERQERERAAAAERERQALLAQNVRTLRTNVDVAIPFVEPAMLHIRLTRKDNSFDIHPGNVTEALRDKLQETAAAIRGAFEAQFLIVDERLIALTDLGRRRPDTVFDGARVFTTERKIAILEAARASNDAAICFFLGSRSDIIALPIDDETRPILTGLIDLLSPKVAVAA